MNINDYKIKNIFHTAITLNSITYIINKRYKLFHKS